MHELKHYEAAPRDFPELLAPLTVKVVESDKYEKEVSLLLLVERNVLFQVSRGVTATGR